MADLWSTLRVWMSRQGSRSQQAKPPTPRDPTQVRKEAALLRTIAAGTMGGLSVDTHEKRAGEKARLEAAAERLEAEAEQLDTAGSREGGE
jgi:hypothetical protein